MSLEVRINCDNCQKYEYWLVKSGGTVTAPIGNGKWYICSECEEYICKDCNATKEGSALCKPCAGFIRMFGRKGKEEKI